MRQDDKRLSSTPANDFLSPLLPPVAAAPASASAAAPAPALPALVLQLLELAAELHVAHVEFPCLCVVDSLRCGIHRLSWEIGSPNGRHDRPPNLHPQTRTLEVVHQPLLAVRNAQKRPAGRADPQLLALQGPTTTHLLSWGCCRCCCCCCCRRCCCCCWWRGWESPFGHGLGEQVALQLRALLLDLLRCGDGLRNVCVNLGPPNTSTKEGKDCLSKAITTELTNAYVHTYVRRPSQAAVSHPPPSPPPWPSPRPPPPPQPPPGAAPPAFVHIYTVVYIYHLQRERGAEKQKPPTIDTVIKFLPRGAR